MAEHLASRDVNVWDGDNYAYELCQVLGLQSEGAVRAGIVHYNDDSDVDRLLRAWPRWPPASPAGALPATLATAPGGHTLYVVTRFGRAAEADADGDGTAG